MKVGVWMFRLFLVQGLSKETLRVFWGDFRGFMNILFNSVRLKVRVVAVRRLGVFDYCWLAFSKGHHVRIP